MCESLDVTLAYLKGKDAESEEAQEHANSSSLALRIDSEHHGGRFLLKCLKKELKIILRKACWFS